MKKKFFKNRSGQMVIIVTFFVVFVVFVFSAVVVDAGVLYSQRRKFVTAADAGALAGAEVMMVGMRDQEDKTSLALSVAEQVARDNQIPSSAEVIVSVEEYDSSVGDNSDYFGRDVIVLEVRAINDNIFAGLFGVDETTVSAKAIGTWGFTRKFEASQFIPLFAFDYEFEEAINDDDRIDLHQGSIYINGEINPPNRDFVEIGSGLSDIKTALSGDLLDDTIEINSDLPNQTGQGNTIVTEIENRMKKASEKSTEDEKIKYMTGVIPIIDSEEFLSNPENTDGNATLSLPIKGFAVMRILDVVDQGSTSNPTSLSTGKGSEFSELNYPNENSRKEYDDYWIDEELGLKAKYTRGTIIGKFVDDELLEVWSIVQDGDQEVEDDSEYYPPYFKLIG